LYKRACTLALNEPQRFFDNYLLFERIHGNLESYRIAYVKIKARIDRTTEFRKREEGIERQNKFKEKITRKRSQQESKENEKKKIQVIDIIPKISESMPSIIPK
jgi:predicted acylesterase/phospholipase RssA